MTVSMSFSLYHGFKMTFVICCQTYKRTANKITASLSYPKLLQRIIVIGINLVFHGAEVHWVCNNVGVSWGYGIIHRVCKESLSVLPVEKKNHHHFTDLNE